MSVASVGLAMNCVFVRLSKLMERGQFWQLSLFDGGL